MKRLFIFLFLIATIAAANFNGKVSMKPKEPTNPTGGRHLGHRS